MGDQSRATGPNAAPRPPVALVVVAAVVLLMTALDGHVGPSPAGQSWSDDRFWRIDRPLADPGALFADGEFDVYTTSAPECLPTGCPTWWVPRFSSRSLAEDGTLQGDAMPERPAWVDPGQRDIWAPSVAHIGDRYVMYFAATSATGPNAGDKCIGLATSPTPAGPFAPGPAPLTCAGPGFWAIDPYAVADGRNWFLLWREDDAAHVRGRIVGAPLTSDGLGVQTTAERTLVVGRYAWENARPPGAPATGAPRRDLPPAAGAHPGGIGPIENPAMARDPDTGQWLLTWSANSWQTSRYATGLAVCRGPLGPCERRSRARPWLHASRDPSVHTDAAFTGAGGLSFVVAPDHRLYAVFHAYRGTEPTSDATRVGWACRVVHTSAGYQLVEL